MARCLVFVVYDGIYHSVFAGQVLAPLLKRLELDNNLCVYLVSFEKNFYSPEQLRDVVGFHPRLTVVVVKKYSFWGAYSLFPAVFRLRKILKSIGAYSIVARGPLAGWIVRRAINKKFCTEIIIQARGLVAEEYQYAHRGARGISRLIHALRARWYCRVERYVYGASIDGITFSIEVVSAALRDYLVERFGTKVSWCVQADFDVPVKVEKNQVTAWRASVRAQLGINVQTSVYCFSGAAKSWQCPELIADYFGQLQKKNRELFFLVLTPDVEKFNALLSGMLLPKSYTVLNVNHQKIYRYLSAADVGIILREPSVISWVARPVKAMEYEAIGLKVIHNNTVDWLIKRFGQNNY